MFGDLGGAVLVAGCLAVAKSKTHRFGKFWLGPYCLWCGVDDLGVLYGSVFGFEGVFDPIWISFTRHNEIAITTLQQEPFF